MPNTVSATVTGKAGPGNTLTAAVFTGITNIALNPATQVWSLTLPGGRVLDIDTSANTTSTLTYSGGLYTLTLS